jgi:type IV secretory pathway TrbF-like protein
MRKIEVYEVKKRLKGRYNETLIGNYNGLRIVFGPHYFIEIRRKTSGKVTLFMGATHHGFEADASDVNSELETFIEEIRRVHPGNAID